MAEGMDLATALRMTADELARCLDCGRPHEYRMGKPHQYREGENLWTWADPDDGHTYRTHAGSDLVDYLRKRAAEVEVDSTTTVVTDEFDNPGTTWSSQSGEWGKSE